MLEKLLAGVAGKKEALGVLTLLKRAENPITETELASASELKYAVIMRTREAMTRMQVPPMGRSVMLRLLADLEENELRAYIAMFIAAADELKNVLSECGDN